MTDRPQGPHWWQASDLKWYPPEKHPNFVPPGSAPPNMTTQLPNTRKAPSGLRNGALLVAALALPLVVAVLVTGRVLTGSFVPVLLIVAVIAGIGAAVMIRSKQSGSTKFVVVGAMVLVVALAIPASLIVIYPAYRYFFEDGTSRASTSSRSMRSPGTSGTGPATPAASRVSVNGQDLPVHGPTVCKVDHEEKGDLIRIQIGDSGYEATMVGTDQITVVEVMVGDIHYGASDGVLTGLGNSAQAERHGKTYKITGNALSWDNKVSTTDSFEIDAVCP